MIVTFGYVGGPPGDPAARSVSIDTASALTPHNYYIRHGFVNGSEASKPWHALLKRTYWPIPVTGYLREGDLAGGIFRLDAGVSVRCSVSEWIALVFAGACDGGPESR
jgi:hypothetical protein